MSIDSVGSLPVYTPRLPRLRLVLCKPKHIQQILTLNFRLPPSPSSSACLPIQTQRAIQRRNFIPEDVYGFHVFRRLAARVFLPRVITNCNLPRPPHHPRVSFLHFLSVLVNHTPLIVFCFCFVFGAISSLTLLPTTFGTRINITHDCYVPHSGKCMFEEDFVPRH